MKLFRFQSVATTMFISSNSCWKKVDVWRERQPGEPKLCLRSGHNGMAVQFFYIRSSLRISPSPLEKKELPTDISGEPRLHLYLHELWSPQLWLHNGVLLWIWSLGRQPYVKLLRRTSLQKPRSFAEIHFRKIQFSIFGYHSDLMSQRSQVSWRAGNICRNDISLCLPQIDLLWSNVRHVI